MKARKHIRMAELPARQAGFNGAAPMKARKPETRTENGPQALMLQWGRADEGAETGLSAFLAMLTTGCFNGAAPMKARKPYCAAR